MLLALKGRVACEINAGDELVTTETIFAGILAELSTEEAMAALSALVFKVHCLFTNSEKLRVWGLGFSSSFPACFCMLNVRLAVP